MPNGGSGALGRPLAEAMDSLQMLRIRFGVVIVLAGLPLFWVPRGFLAWDGDVGPGRFYSLLSGLLFWQKNLAILSTDYLCYFVYL